ncbi:hypothetical protein [Paraglaciecola chathamensis]|jgi:hypothetical protein|nr:hypothetical protein [Paraglaciecola chathamensis]MDO6557634.1 hypothetical protein [Paraglaciecola chathamensis]|tara:strand:+ start:3069 stop:3197 length:129 start_codon:yes stop_codon:yes gene_type:complete
MAIERGIWKIGDKPMKFKTPPLPMMKSVYGSAAAEMLELATA